MNNKDKLIEKLEEYIVFLGKELDKFSSLQITHPHLVEVYTEESEVIKEGKKLREEIKALKDGK